MRGAGMKLARRAELMLLGAAEPLTAAETSELALALMTGANRAANLEAKTLIPVERPPRRAAARVFRPTVYEGGKSVGS